MMISLFISMALAQSGAPTGTFVNPSVPNGVESNPYTFENTQPVIGATPAPTPVAKKHSKLPPGKYKMEKESFVANPDQQGEAPPEPKQKN